MAYRRKQWIKILWTKKISSFRNMLPEVELRRKNELFCSIDELYENLGDIDVQSANRKEILVELLT